MSSIRVKRLFTTRALLTLIYTETHAWRDEAVSEYAGKYRVQPVLFEHDHHVDIIMDHERLYDAMAKAYNECGGEGFAPTGVIDEHGIIHWRND